MATLINGDGNQAIYAQQDADWFASIIGGQTLITAVGNKFAYELLDANTIGVKDGVIITKEGRRIQLDANAIDSFDIPTGGQGTTNYYIIGYHLVTGDLSEQTAETFVQLMDNSTDTIPEGSFRDGDDDVYISLYRVQQNDLTLGTITLLLPQLTGSLRAQINEMNNTLANKANISDVTFGDQIEADISISTGAEVGKYIREHVSLLKLQKGYVFNLIPIQTPGWFSGIIYCDQSTWGPGATCWGFYMNRDNNILYKYNCAYGGADSVTPFSGNISPSLIAQWTGSNVTRTFTFDPLKSYFIGGADQFNDGNFRSFCAVLVRGNIIPIITNGYFNPSVNGNTCNIWIPSSGSTISLYVVELN